MPSLQNRLDSVLREFNQRQYLHSDPIQIPHRYLDPLDREFVSFFTALFCFGNVKAILKAVNALLDPLGPNPRLKIQSFSDAQIKKVVGIQKYRFFTADDICFALIRLRDIYRKHPQGLKSLLQTKTSPLEAMIELRKAMTESAPATNGIRFMFPDPEAGAAKRLHMFFRWMVRKDEIDFGLWDFLSPSALLIPLDVHLFEICRGLKLTKLKSPSLKAMTEITNQLRKLDADDPIKYDFALCRIGILGLKKSFLSPLKAKNNVPSKHRHRQSLLSPSALKARKIR